MIQQIKDRNEKAHAGARELEILKATFPQCFHDGRFDKEAFLHALPGGLEVTDETSGFNWLGKNYGRMLYNMDSTTVICPDEEHNALPENRDSQNVYISGDNLDALQHLVKSYAGRVKVIYIDPPYNTGSDGFVYNDKFKFTAEELADKLGVDDDRAERILSMTRRKSASHAAWLTFMLPRLSFARDLLSKDGVIFISIDENEQANLRLLCNEVFGEENVAGEIVWKNSSKNDEDYISMQHEYILCYVKSKEHNIGDWKEKKQGTDEIFAAFERFRAKHGSDWKAIHKEAQEWYKQFNEANPIYSSRHYSWMDERGVYFPDNISGPNFGQYVYDVVHPITGKICKAPASGWRYEKTSMKEKIDNGLIHFGDDESTVPNSKTYLKDTLYQSLPSIIYRDGRVASKRLTTLMGTNCFSNPKDVEVITKLLNAVGIKDGDIVVDFFSGSGTTAEAVLSLGEQEKQVKFIAVQIQEDLDESLKRATGKGKTIVKNAIQLCNELRVPHTVDEIGMERIKRAAVKIREANPLFAGDLGFKHFTLKEATQDTLDKMDKFNKDAIVSNTTLLDDFGTNTVLRTWLMADGYGLTAEATPLQLGNYVAYHMDKHLYLINSEDDFNEDSMVALVDLYQGTPFSPQNVVLFGYSFGAANRVMISSNLRSLNSGNKSLQITVTERY